MCSVGRIAELWRTRGGALGESSVKGGQHSVWPRGAGFSGQWEVRDGVKFLTPEIQLWEGRWRLGWRGAWSATLTFNEKGSSES